MTELRERAVAFVVARLSSSRLPQKQLRQIGGKSILDWIMDELGACRELDQVVVATVAEPDNVPLRDLAAARGWACFWYDGGVDDVVGRLVAAAHRYDAGICLLISADCPLVHGASVDRLVARFRRHRDADYLVLPPRAPGQVPLLEGVQVARLDAWQRADAMSDRPELREHQFPVIYRNPDRFRAVDATLDAALYGDRHRMSVDTWADLEFMQTLHQHLAADGRPFQLPEAVALLDRNPQLKAVNAHVHQRKLVEDVRRVLFVVDAGREYGFGHLMRCRELAGQLVERLGWPVAFALDDPDAAGLVEACGFSVFWGAAGRRVRSTGAGRPPHGLEAVVPAHDLVVVDISVRRTLDPGWRDAFAPTVPAVVVDREDAMAAEADLILYPGVSGRVNASRGGLPPIVEGLEHVVLRREVRRYRDLRRDRDIDLLAYLADPDRRREVAELAVRRGWRCVLPEGFDDRFPELLSRSRAFLSGYGHSFYEAVALGVHPVAWPLSTAHAADAAAFYRALGMAPRVVDSAGGLGDLLEPIVAGRVAALPALDDGTPRIVARLQALANEWG